MCGIAGFAGDVPVDGHRLRRMADAIRHRGPDSDGFLIERGRVGLGFRRLSIIDLAGGDQPLHNEDRTVSVTCNGEIYNFIELRQDLMRRGHSFATGSDVEVLAHLYEERGTGLLTELQGMYAMALWDHKENKLLLARDRMGKKPLYWAQVPGGILYASEPAAILASGLIEPEPDLEALVEYLTLQYVPPPRSGFRGVHKLEPGEALTFQDGRIERFRYWRLEHPAKPRHTEAEPALEELDALLRDATRCRLIADVPVGAFLSGGIDSSIVVAYMAELADEVRTFSIDYPVAGFSEGAHARKVAERFGTDHTEMLVEPDMVPVVAAAARQMGEPFADSSAIPQYLVSQVTRRHVTVALSGDGGDEAFGGYERYRVAAGADRLGPAARLIGRAGQVLMPASLVGRAPRVALGFEALAESRHDRYAKMMAEFFPERLARLCRPELLEAAGGPRRTWESYLALPDVKGVNRYMALDIETYLPGDILAKVDRMSMAHSLEVRSPMMDYRFYELAAALPGNFKVRGATLKWLLKELAVRKGVPADVVHRRKQGFSIPIGPWFRKDLRGWLEGILRDPATQARGYFRQEAVDSMLDEHIAGRADHTHRLWNLAMLELWHRDWIDAAPAVARAA
jgi:asparagine synthase (glutamine-hydrolysing)